MALGHDFSNLNLATELMEHRVLCLNTTTASFADASSINCLHSASEFKFSQFKFLGWSLSGGMGLTVCCASV